MKPKKSHKALTTALVLLMVLSLAACGDKTSQTTPPDTGETPTYRLVANFSDGAAVDASVLRYEQKPITCSYLDPATKQKVETYEAYADAAMEMSRYLTEWTGLDFSLNSVIYLDGDVLVDWSRTSTLTAGIGNREMKEGFIFFDDATLNWFMMDTMYSTLKENLPVNDVYYCTDFDVLQIASASDMAEEGLTELSPNVPYLGSAYYMNTTVYGLGDMLLID